MLLFVFGSGGMSDLLKKLPQQSELKKLAMYTTLQDLNLGHQIY